MTACQTRTYRGLHGRTLHAVLWQPDGPPRGMIQLLHGLSEHTLRYTSTAEVLCRAGFAVCGVDLPGHGRSDSDAPAFLAKRDGWQLALEIVHGLRAELGGDWPCWFLLGHSMGSFLARSYLIRWPGEADGALLSGTGQQTRPVLLLGRALAGLLALPDPQRRPTGLQTLSTAVYNHRIRPRRTDLDWISRDPAAVDGNLADPLCRNFPSIGFLRDILDGLLYIGTPEHLAQMDPTTPVLFFSGDCDPVGSYGHGVRRAAALFSGCRDVTVRLYPGARHEILHETNRSEVLADVLAWLDIHTKEAAS